LESHLQVGVFLIGNCDLIHLFFKNELGGGEVATWGLNMFGQLGHGDNESSGTPKKIASLKKGAYLVATGSAHTLLAKGIHSLSRGIFQTYLIHSFSSFFFFHISRKTTLLLGKRRSGCVRTWR
jgi:hypothetical protein